MKRVWLHAGYQRMAGEVKKLEKPLAVVGRRSAGESDEAETAETESGEANELEIKEIIRWKILINGRPEPVGLSGT